MSTSIRQKSTFDIEPMNVPQAHEVRMLYDYHVYQNEQKSSSIHATYLVYGLKASEKRNGVDGDVNMSMSSSMPEQEEDDEEKVPTYTLSLVREENLSGKIRLLQLVQGLSLTAKQTL